jgi:Fic family protein
MTNEKHEQKRTSTAIKILSLLENEQITIEEAQKILITASHAVNAQLTDLGEKNINIKPKNTTMGKSYDIARTDYARKPC